MALTPLTSKANVNVPSAGGLWVIVYVPSLLSLTVTSTVPTLAVTVLLPVLILLPPSSLAVNVHSNIELTKFVPPVSFNSEHDVEYGL